MIIEMNRRKRFSINTLVCAAHHHRSMTPMFEAILTCSWTALLSFLETENWDSRLEFCDSTLTPSQQAQKWIVYNDRYSNEKLRQLPLHAAITHLAPLRIIKLLVQLYPNAIAFPDSKGNLPLHIAFLTSAHDVSAFLLKAYPQALMVANESGNLPVECYQQVFRTVHNKHTHHGSEEDIRIKERRELLEIKQSIANDHRQLSTIDLELQDLKEDIQNICNYGRRRIMAYSTIPQLPDAVDL